jgi:hypothetical protein
MSYSARNDYSVQSYQDESVCLLHNKPRHVFQTPLTSNMPLATKIILVPASSNIMSTSPLLNDSHVIFVAFVVYKMQLRRKVPRSDSRIRWFKYRTLQQWNSSPSSEFWHYTCNCITAPSWWSTIYDTLVCSKHLEHLSVWHDFFFQFTRPKGFNACILCEFLAFWMLHTCPSHHSHRI